MSQFTLDPPLTLKGNIVVRNIDDAVRFMVGHQKARRALYRRASFTVSKERSAKQKSGTPAMHSRLGRDGTANRQI